MDRPYQVLLVEDSASDADLIQLQLQRAGLTAHCTRVDDPDGLQAALSAPGWDIVLTDHNLPQMDSFTVLAQVQAAGLTAPCILVSGAIGEELAVGALKAGATDYVRKDNLQRLGSAVKRALREAAQERARRAAEERLQVLEAAVQAVTEGLVVLATPAGPQGSEIVFVNDGFLRITGFSRDQVLRPMAELLARAGMAADLQQYILTGIQNGIPIAGETDWVRPDGTITTLEWSGQPMRDGGGRITHWVSVQRDITERRRAAATLHQQQELFRLVTDNASDLVALQDPTGAFLYVSPSCAWILGYTPAEMAAQTGLDLVHPDERPVLTDAVRASVKGGQPARVTYRIRHRLGHYLWFESLMRPIRNPGGRTERLVSSSRDVTLRVEAETQLQARIRQQQVVAELGHAALMGTDIEQLMAQAADQVAATLGVEDCTIMELRPGGQALRLRAHGGGLEPLPPEVPLGEDRNSLFGFALDQAEAVMVEDLATELRFPPPAHLLARGVTSCLSVIIPGDHQLRADSRQAYGVLSALSTQHRRFSRDDAHFLVAVANVLATAIHRGEVEETLRSTNQTLGALIQSSPLAIVVVDRAGQVVAWNPAARRMFGWTEADVLGKPVPLRPEGGEDFSDTWKRVLAGEVFTDLEVRFLRRDGVPVDVSVSTAPLHDANDQVTGVMGIAADVTERKRQEEQIRFLALHDPLTNLSNRRALEEHLQQSVLRSRRGARGALLLLDLDNFKLVNDTLGHGAGDQFLAYLVERLVRVIRPGDLLARLGGDEFAVLLDDVTLDEARAVAERCRLAVEDFQFELRGHNFVLGVSIGIAPVADGDAQQVMAMADSALYAAKDAGKNRVVIREAPDAPDVQLAAASQWVGRIKHALREEGLRLYFQPVVELNSGAVAFYEALLRLHDPELGLVEPSQFLPTAERFGLMSQIDGWVVEAALANLRAHPDLRIFVNLSARSLGDEGLLERVRDHIRQSGVAPHRLAFEITETVAVGDLVRAQHWMRRLTDLGCRFALDDFGTGFTSFSYLRSLPVDHVKIGGTFVRNLDTDHTNRALVQAMVTAIHALDKTAVAEWVEEPAVAVALMMLGVRYGQGYLFGRPSPRLPALPVWPPGLVPPPLPRAETGRPPAGSSG